MKYIFGIIYIISLLVLIIVLRKCKKNKNPTIFSAKGLYYSAIVSTFANIIILFSQNKLLSCIFYSIFTIGIDGVIFFLLAFSLFYVNFKHSKKYILIPVLILSALDSINMIFNIFFHHAFTIKEIVYKNSVYLVSSPLFSYQLHLVLSYSTIFIAFCFLLYKSFVCPKMYRVKYLLIFVSFGLLTILDAVYLSFNIPIDFTVILFSATGVLYYYITFHFTPRALLERSLSLVVEHMDNSIVFFDENGKCIYQNKSFDDIYTKYKNLGILPDNQYLDSWYENDFFKNEIDFSHDNQEINKAIKVNERIHILNVKFHIIRDEKDKFVGSFFLIQDKTKDEEIIRYEKYLSTHDSLTGLYNKSYFFERTRAILQKNPDEEYVLISVKLINYNFITKVFGNLLVNQFIIKLSQEIAKIGKDRGIFGRLDENNFVLLMKKSNLDIESFTKYSSELHTISEDKYFPTTILTGIYEVEDIHTPISIMCERANIAINEIANNSTEKIGYYTSKIKNKNQFEQILFNDFPKAIAEKQFKIFLQPQFTKTKKLCGAEILVRWLHPNEGLMPPEDFLSLFEDKGIITQLDMFIWEETAKILKSWKDKNITNIPLSVNISSKDLCYLDIYKFFTDLVQKYEIDPKLLKLEITESTLFLDTENQISVISKLRQAGFTIELDDFGIGYSSLNLLRDFSFDELKLDLTCFDSIEENFQDKTSKIIETIVELAKKLEIPLIAEGVETENHFEFLKKAGCKYFQGFYLEKPIDLSLFEKKYIN
ncbi:MAG: EAL domain-containing protein [Treponemataceae bacterium]|nr:EAL domain-containing protein [Treponemataceae bacterium]